MFGFENIGRMLILFGAVLIVVGLVFFLGGKFLNLGRLPGDIYIKQEGFSFYFPLVTCIIISLVLTFILNLFLRR